MYESGEQSRMKPAKEMDTVDFANLIINMVKDAENYRDQLTKDRVTAQQYYDGIMTDMPVAGKGRSSVVSRDVRSTIKKIMPSIRRTILGNDKIVEFQPAGHGDEEFAQQATEYMNAVVLSESDGRNAIYDAMHDALKLRNGVLHWWCEEKTEIKVSRHYNLDDNSFALLVSDEGVEVLEHTAKPGEMDGAASHDVVIKRTDKGKKIKLGAVPLDEFLIDPDALHIKESILVGRVKRVTRSDLVAMGYDRELVEHAPSWTDAADQENKIRRPRALDNTNNDPNAASQQLVLFYELYARIDHDGDGISELRRIVFIGKVHQDLMVENEYWDDVPFSSLTGERRPHQWEGTSITDDMMELQRIKTALLRETLDNIYWQNSLQPAYQHGAVLNPDALYAPEFGKPIVLREGLSARDAVQWNVVPFVAEKSFQMIEYLDREGQDRTGINDASGGLAPDAMQNVTAKATALMEQAGLGIVDMVVNTLADGGSGIRDAMRGLLKLSIQYQDKARTIRLRDKWVEFDPRQWNSEMDCSINTGLGAGTRERDMVMLAMVQGLQEKLFAMIGPTNPFVTPDNIWNSISKTVEASGLKTPEMYFTKPSPEQGQALQQPQPTPEQQKAQAQMQVEQMKAQIMAQLEEKKMQVQANQELAQMQADIETEKAKAEVTAQLEQMKAMIAGASQMDELDFKRQEHDDKMKLEYAKLQVTGIQHDDTTGLQRDKMEMDGEMTMAQHDLQRDEKGKPVNAEAVRGKNMEKMLSDLQALAKKPKKVVTPDGEEFTMEMVN
jgi:hypothetical protein